MTEKFTVVNSTLDMVEQLEAVQRVSFPTLAEEEIMTAAHYAVQIKQANAPESARSFLIYLQSEKVQDRFAKLGFQRP